MNLDELLKSIPPAEANQPLGLEGNGSSASSLQLRGSLSIGSTVIDKTVDEMWREIQQGEKTKNSDVMKTERKPTLGEMTLEDFLAKAGAFAESSLSPGMGLDTVDVVTPQKFSRQMGLSPAASLGAQSDTPGSGRKRDTPDAIERSIERKLRRKIKNRESAARSRARKQAYHNELVSKVSRLEVENMKLKKEKEVEICAGELIKEPRFLQLNLLCVGLVAYAVSGNLCTWIPMSNLMGKLGDMMVVVGSGEGEALQEMAVEISVDEGLRVYMVVDGDVPLWNLKGLVGLYAREGKHDPWGELFTLIL
ncbi:hypothetical protein Ancab_010737 [Ancistrocladus abbreviatus]